MVNCSKCKVQDGACVSNSKPRKEPTCTPGRTRKCGKSCISLTRRCKKPGFEYEPPPAPEANDHCQICRTLLDANAAIRNNRAPPANATRNNNAQPNTPCSMETGEL